MLSLQNAGKRFGPRVLFLEANWLIRAREKTALVEGIQLVTHDKQIKKSGMIPIIW